MTDSSFQSDETTDIDTSPGAQGAPSFQASFQADETTDTDTAPYVPPQRSIWGPLWEFQIIYTDFEMVDERRLNALGDERWELMAMGALPNERFQFVFRRSR